jgi:hypothetical protein
MQPKYPHVTVQLTGQDGNAYAILGRVRRALTRADVPEEEIDEFTKRAMSSDYSHLLQVVMETVDAR